VTQRAHRIGQLRPITGEHYSYPLENHCRLLSLAVKTLAIRGTAEEHVVTRRNAFRNSQEKLPKMIEEAGMRHYIAVRFFSHSYFHFLKQTVLRSQNPKFITQTPTLTPTINFAFINLPPESSGPPAVEPVIILKIPPLSTPPRKRIRVEGPVIEPSSSSSNHTGKRIRFAD
jgi:hypothetical protein